MNIAKAIVPVAGLGTRLLPTTKSLPKEMLPVGRLPVVHHVVEELAAAGIRQILFVTGRGKSAIEDYFDDSAMSYRERGIEFFSARQPQPPGTGTAVATGEAFAAGEPFVVAFGDSIVRTNSGQPLLQRMIDSHLHHRAAGTIGAYEVSDEQMHHYGILVPEEATAADSKLTAILEKPTPAQTLSRLAVSARYVFSPAILRPHSRHRPLPERRGISHRRHCRPNRRRCPGARRALGCRRAALRHWQPPILFHELYRLRARRPGMGSANPRLSARKTSGRLTLTVFCKSLML